MNRILIIDDDSELCELLSDYLTPEGFEVQCIHDGQQGADEDTKPYNLVVLDVMLPQLNGFDVLRQIRQKSQIPVIMLTARGDDIDRIVGLELGADDYLPKPFNPRELLARIRAIQRRAENQSPTATPNNQQLTVGDVQLSLGSRQVVQNGKILELTSVEFSLLQALLNQAGQVVSREELVEQVLGRRLSPYDRSIDVHISSLRKKLGPVDDNHERIKTVRGVGYLYALPVEEN